MCGLVGIAGNIGYKGEKFFKRLLELDTYRGPHSTGILAVDDKGDTQVAKQLGTPWDLYEHKSCSEIFRKTGHRVLLGHNRWATKGKINRHNAHPFEFDTVVGAHNGTLNSTFNLDDASKFDVDSENIYHDMNLNGAHETIPKLNGAFALTWYDKVDGTINFVRNDQRPLFYAMSEDKKTLAWASEPWMIVVAAQQAEIKFSAAQELPVGVLHTFDVPMSYASAEFEKVRVRRIELYKAPVRVVYSSGNTITGNVYTSTSLKEVVTAKVKRPFASYQPHVGKDCLFYVGNVGKSNTGQSFIQCWLVEDEEISIRIFAIVESDLWRLLMSSQNYFKGHAKAYSGVENGYLTIDLRTIEEVKVDDNGDVLEDVAMGFEGEEITKTEFNSRALKGCSWCGNPVPFEDHEEVVWIAKRDCLCGSCATQDEVKIYLTH